MSDAPANPADIRLVAIDLDGTLLTDAKRISRRTVEALRGLPQRGVRVVIASARPPQSVRPVYETLGLQTLQINYNGALVWDEGDRRPVFHQPIIGRIGRRIVEAARRLSDEIEVGYEVLDRWYTDRRDDRPDGQSEMRFTRHDPAPLETFIDLEPTKIRLLGPPEAITRVEQFLHDYFTYWVAVHRLKDVQLQAMDRRVGKATALWWVAGHYGIEMRHVMAIGDAPNDVAMLRSAGVAVAMDNAHPLVKKAAGWIAPSNNDHGVCAALERCGLCD